MQYVDMVIEAFDAELVSVSESEIPSEDIEEDVREGGKYFVQETEEGKILEGVGDVVEGVEDVLGVANFFHNDTIGVEDVVEGVEDVLEGAIEGVGDLAEGKGVVESVENAKGPFPSASESEALSEAVETLHSQKRRVVRFKVRVLSSPAGEMRPDEAVTIEYDDQQLQVVIQQLEARVLDPTGLIVL